MTERVLLTTNWQFVRTKSLQSIDNTMEADLLSTGSCIEASFKHQPRIQPRNLIDYPNDVYSKAYGCRGSR